VGIKAEGNFCENGAKQVVGDLLKRKIPQGFVTLRENVTRSL